MIQQIELTLPSFSRGFHLITNDIIDGCDALPEIGMLHVFIKHTSAGLCINENVDPSVRVDFESFYNRLAPENAPFVTHTAEGPDDMPAHIKASITGSSVSIPISDGALNLGTWQGIYLCEFRDRSHTRKLVLSIYS